MISTSAQFPGPDVDECTFPGPDALTSEFPGVDFAVVAFPPAPMPVIEGVAHFTGVGYLTVDVFGIAKVAALFSGSGSAMADSIAWGGVKQAAAMFAGSGDFAVIARAVQRATYSGSGSLAAKIATALAATLSGSGQAAFTSSAIGIAPFTLNGEGTATATVVAVGGAYSVSANFTGEGSATAKVVPAVTSGFNGSGSASAAVASAIKSLFNGSGTNTAKVASAVKAGFNGSGTASATMVPAFTAMGVILPTANSWTSTSPRKSLGWSADSAFPGTVVVSDGIQVNGSKVATVAFDLTYRWAWTGSVNVAAYVAGVQRGSTVSWANPNANADYNKTGEITVTVAAGETVDLYIWTSHSFAFTMRNTSKWSIT